MRKLLFALTFIAALASISQAQAVTCPGNAPHCVTVNFTAPTTGGAATSYKLYRGTASGQCTSSVTSCTLVATGPGLTLIDSTSTLAGATTYFYWVTGVNAAGEGPAGGGLGPSFTTTADVPGLPNPVTIDSSQSK